MYEPMMNKDQKMIGPFYDEFKDLLDKYNEMDIEFAIFACLAVLKKKYKQEEQDNERFQSLLVTFSSNLLTRFKDE